MFCYSRVAPQQNKTSGNRKKKTVPGFSILAAIAAKSPKLTPLDGFGEDFEQCLVAKLQLCICLNTDLAMRH